MFDKNDESVTYIENEEGVINEVTIVPNLFNKKKLLKDKLGYCTNTKLGNGYLFNKNPDLELIYFKNFTFDKSLNFGGSYFKRIILVLDNCTFKGDIVDFISFGSVQIVNPNFEYDGKIRIHGLGVDDVDIILDKNSNFDKQFEIEVYGCRKFNFNGNGCEGDFWVKSSDVCIKGVNVFESIKVDSDRLKIVNSNIFCCEKEGNDEWFDKCFIDIDTKDIQLFNSSIVSNFHNVSGNGCRLIFDKLSGDNYEIKFSGGIRVSDDYYTNTSLTQYCTLFSDKISCEQNLLVARRNLIAILKSVKDKAYDEVNFNTKMVEDFYDDELGSQRIKLKRMEEDAKREINTYRRRLVRNKISDFID